MNIQLLKLDIHYQWRWPPAEDHADWMQDVGSTFGMGANGPHDWDEGWESLFAVDPFWKRLVSFGFYLLAEEPCPHHPNGQISFRARPCWVYPESKEAP